MSPTQTCACCHLFSSLARHKSSQFNLQPPGQARSNFDIIGAPIMALQWWRSNRNRIDIDSHNRLQTAQLDAMGIRRPDRSRLVSLVQALALVPMVGHARWLTCNEPDLRATPSPLSLPTNFVMPVMCQTGALRVAPS